MFKLIFDNPEIKIQIHEERAARKRGITADEYRRQRWEQIEKGTQNKASDSDITASRIPSGFRAEIDEGATPAFILFWISVSIGILYTFVQGIRAAIEAISPLVAEYAGVALWPVAVIGAGYLLLLLRNHMSRIYGLLVLGAVCIAASHIGPRLSDTFTVADVTDILTVLLGAVEGIQAFRRASEFSRKAGIYDKAENPDSSNSV